MLSKAGFATLTPIKDMDRAIKFYTKTLGGKLQMRAPGEMRDMFASVKIGREEFWLVHPPTAQGKKPDVAFSTFIVKDVKAEVKELRKRGARFQAAEKMDKNTKIDGPVATDAFGSVAFMKDSEGNLLMLWQDNM